VGLSASLPIIAGQWLSKQGNEELLEASFTIGVYKPAAKQRLCKQLFLGNGSVNTVPWQRIHTQQYLLLETECFYVVCAEML
jgi:hypothetical protein